MGSGHMRILEANEKDVIAKINSLPIGERRDIAELQHTIILATKTICEALYETRY